jgi:GT2 family glycosyltransferase
MAEGITAIVTAYQRVEQTLLTLHKLDACVPPADETIVHVDGNSMECAAAIRAAHPRVKVMVSESNVGPGGGRNLLVAAAAHPIVASFDDDSYPIDVDYFARVAEVFASSPDASIVGARVYHSDESIDAALRQSEWVADFVGCGCVYRRGVFLKTGGYVPLPMAYGMEEVDLALRLHAQRGRILQTSWLRVFHDTDRARHADPRVTSASIANIALLAYLRYPVSLWTTGLMQMSNRIQWLIRNGRLPGVISGIARIPSHLLGHRSYRNPLPSRAVRSYLELRRRPIPAGR